MFVDLTSKIMEETGAENGAQMVVVVEKSAHMTLFSIEALPGLIQRIFARFTRNLITNDDMIMAAYQAGLRIGAASAANTTPREDNVPKIGIL